MARFYSQLNCKVILVTRKETLEFIPQRNFFSQVYILKKQNEFEELSQKWPNKCDLFIIDQYSKNYDYQKKISAWAKHIFVIDDFENQKHFCDMTLNQNLDNNFVLSKSCIKLTGPYFSLLDLEYQIDRKKALVIRKNNQKIKTILVSFGLTDYKNLILKIIREISSVDEHVRFIIPLNKKVISKNNLKNKIKNLNIKNSIKFYTNLSYLGKLMLESDICIGSLGTSTWERCVLGLPSIGIKVVDNQKHVFQFITKNNCSLVFDKEKVEFAKELKSKYFELISTKKLYNDLAINSFQVCDGKGVLRVGIISFNLFRKFLCQGISLRLNERKLKENSLNDKTTFDVFFENVFVGFAEFDIDLQTKKLFIKYNHKKKYLSAFSKLNKVLKFYFKNFKIENK